MSFLGIDVGGTTIRVAAYGNTNPSSMLCDPMTFPVTGVYHTDLIAIKEACMLLMTAHGGLEGLGIAVAGVVHKNRRSLTKAPNLRHWERNDVITDLSLALRCQVILGNDAEAPALAEALYGSGKNQDFWFIIWGTGVGGALVRQGPNGPIALPGEPGHHTVNPSGSLLCACGQRNCLEAYCGGAGIAKRFGVDPQDLLRDDWADVVCWMSVAIQNLATIQPVPLVIFGGGVAAKQRQLLSDIEERLQETMKVVPAPKLLLSAYGETAGTHGALALLGA